MRLSPEAKVSGRSVSFGRLASFRAAHPYRVSAAPAQQILSFWLTAALSIAID